MLVYGSQSHKIIAQPSAILRLSRQRRGHILDRDQIRPDQQIAHSHSRASNRLPCPKYTSEECGESQRFRRAHGTQPSI
jgi:hypothetical protein